MIRVTLEVTNGPTTRRVQVVAPTIEQALASYDDVDGPCAARVVFPIDPDEFFVAQGVVAEAPSDARRRAAEVVAA
jgi:hypothetical protein